MRILIVLTYYRPYTSGLTVYAERLARALAQRGHEVRVLTSRYDRSLPLEEELNGVRVVRAPVALRLGKGVIMPGFGFLAWKLVRWADVLSVHLPQFDAAGVALRGRLLRKPTVLTYHCDLRLPPGVFNRAADQIIGLVNLFAGRFAHRIVGYTRDFAGSSAFLNQFQGKLDIIPPPVELPPVDPFDIAAFAAHCRNAGRRPVIGIATRLAAEKGVDVLLEAFPRIVQHYPHACILAAGQHIDVLGEQACYQRLQPAIERLERSGQWISLGVLSPQQMAAFYKTLDLLVVPSLNSTESFGLVQVEAMLQGVPCVASDLPGVRQPVRITGMGAIAPAGDPAGLADAVLHVLDNPAAHVRPAADFADMFSPHSTAVAYEQVFAAVAHTLQRGGSSRPG